MTDKGVISNIYKQFVQHNLKKILICKMGRRTEQTILHTDTQNAGGQHAHEKTNTLNYQGNANQDHNEISPYTCQNGYVKKTKTHKCWQGCREKGTLVHLRWECTLVQLLWKTRWRFLKKKKKQNYHMTQHAFIFKKQKYTLIYKDTCTPISIVILLTVAKIWNQPKCPSTDDKC